MDLTSRITTITNHAPWVNLLTLSTSATIAVAVAPTRELGRHLQVTCHETGTARNV
jgi:hypothetical protein